MKFKRYNHKKKNDQEMFEHSHNFMQLMLNRRSIRDFSSKAIPDKVIENILNFYDYKTGKVANEEWCQVKTIDCPSEFRRPDLVLDVNTYDQYIFMKKLYEYLYPRNNKFTILDTINWFDKVYIKSKK